MIIEAETVTCMLQDKNGNVCGGKIVRDDSWDGTQFVCKKCGAVVESVASYAESEKFGRGPQSQLVYGDSLGTPTSTGPFLRQMQNAKVTQSLLKGHVPEYED